MDAVNQKALEDLKKYRADSCHMLVPCMDQIAEVAQGFRLIVTPVNLRPHPKDKDVYPHEGGHYSPYKNDWYEETGEGKWKRKIVPSDELVRVSGQGLEKLAQHVALVWDKPHVMVDKDFKGRQLCELAGAVRMPDGFSFYRMADAYGMDLDIVREQLEATYIKGETDAAKVKDGQKKVDRDLLQKKANQTKLCISGARNRIIRKILGIDGTYTVASLSKPFIAVRVIPWLDMSDEYTRRLVTEMNVKQMAITSLFGGQMPEPREIAAPESVPAISYESNIPQDKCREDDDVFDVEVPDTDDAPPFGMPPDSSTPTTAESLRADFQACDMEGQCKTLRTLIADINAAKAVQDWLAAFKPPATLETLTDKMRVTLYDHLCKMAGKEGGR